MRLETERLILREFTIDDLDAFAWLLAEPEVMRFSLSGPIQDREHAREYLQKWILDHYVQYGYGVYAVITKADNTLIGFIGLINQMVDGENKTELTYRLHPRYWGQGLAIEACKVACHHAFSYLGIQELISIIDPANIRSLKVAEHIGMSFWKETLFYDTSAKIFALKNDLIFHFKHVTPTERSLVHSWLVQPYVSEWFYGQGLENTFKHLDEFLAGSSFAQYWLAFDKDYPFAFLITSYVDKPHDELTKWCSSDGQAITLDMLIGDPNYLGKGYAVQVIHQFLFSQFPSVSEVLIDPEATNIKAIHVYQKAGFKILGEFIPSHSPHPHYMMRLNLQELKNQLALEVKNNAKK